MSDVGKILLVAVVITTASSACGDSGSNGPRTRPTPAPASPTPTSPAPTPAPDLNLACGSDLEKVRLAAAGSTFLAIYDRRFTEAQSRVEGIRFLADRTVLDRPPLRIFGGEGPLQPDFSVTDVTGLDPEFAIQIFGTRTSDLGATQQELYYRTLPTTGPLGTEAQGVVSHVGLGSCRTYLGRRAAISYDLAATTPRFAVQWGAACAGQGTLLEWIDGVPWQTIDPFNSTETSEGWPALARSSNAVAGVFASAPTVNRDDSQRVLIAGWIESLVPNVENTRETLTSLTDRTSERPGLAALGETFLVVWSSAPDRDSALSELRGLRFSATEGALDPDGGQVLASASAIRSPVVSANGSEFLVVWAEPADEGESLFLQRLGEDGSPAASDPREIANIAAGSPFDLASTSTAVAVGYYAPNDTGETCLQVTMP